MIFTKNLQVEEVTHPGWPEQMLLRAHQSSSLRLQGAVRMETQETLRGANVIQRSLERSVGVEILAGARRCWQLPAPEP